MRTDSDSNRITKLGAPSGRVKISGNIKFDIEMQESKIQKGDLNLTGQDLLLLAGSTHPGEEEIILEVYKNLITQFSNLRLLVAPRHIERIEEIKKLALGYKLEVIRMSEVNKNISSDPKKIFILDSIGQLAGLYKIADIVFMGGSLVKKGGQNILEPAVFSKPTLFGPYMFNFSEIRDLFLRENAAIEIIDKSELEKNLRWLLHSPEEIDKLGRKAREIVQKNKGATFKTVELVKEFIN